MDILDVLYVIGLEIISRNYLNKGNETDEREDKKYFVVDTFSRKYENRLLLAYWKRQ
jgi:L-lysine 2,3-aminomutase